VLSASGNISPCQGWNVPSHLLFRQGVGMILPSCLSNLDQNIHQISKHTLSHNFIIKGNDGKLFLSLVTKRLERAKPRRQRLCVGSCCHGDSCEDYRRHTVNHNGVSVWLLLDPNWKTSLLSPFSSRLHYLNRSSLITALTMLN